MRKPRHGGRDPSREDAPGAHQKIRAMSKEDALREAIDAAEEVRDPRDDLVSRTAADPSAAFAPEALERLAALRRNDYAAFEALRAQLKKAGCRVTALDEALAEESGEVSGRGPTHADILID